MLLVTALASFVVLATRVAADPKAIRDSPFSLSITKHWQTNDAATFHPSKRFKNLLKGSQKRSQKCSAVTSVSTENNTEVALLNTAASYLARVGVGVPPVYYNLIVDTGSSVTWVGANTTYKMTNTSVKTRDRVGVSYGTGNFTGFLYNDTVTFAPGLAVSQQPIGVAVNSSGISFDGILGIGPKNLTIGALSPDNTTIIPTVTDLLFEQKVINQNIVAVSFEPVNSGPGLINGELTFGATDPTKYTGDIKYFPLTERFPASMYWGVEGSVQYGGDNGSASVNILSTNSGIGILDTGTTMISLSTDAYQRYVSATGAVMNETMNMLYITPAQYEKLQPLFFNIGGSSFELTPNAQIWPRALNTALGVKKDLIYLMVKDMKQGVLGLDFICGMTFIERFYTVFDTTHRRLGLATTPFTNAEVN